MCPTKTRRSSGSSRLIGSCISALSARWVYRKSTLLLKHAPRGADHGAGFCPIDPSGDLAEAAVRATAWDGRFLVIGFAAGDIPKIPLNLVLLKGCALVGVFWGRFSGEEPEQNVQNIRELTELFESGKLSPLVTEVYPLEQYEDAYNCMIERRARGKVIMTM